uniref:Uncharacterized protein n=1 Tax=Cyanothece sp. (strain PCC 7425 / ATCC 29141) TaxID=395961 RepID=B8HN10_CYAP4
MSESNQWSREECRNRYVRGEKISLRELSRLSSRALGLLGRWCKEDGWTEQREQYQTEQRSEIDKKTIERTSSKISEFLSELSLEHAQAYRTPRRIAEFILRQVESKIEALESTHPEMQDPDALRESLKALIQDSHPATLNLLSQVIDRCVRGERMVSGAEYDDINKAIERIERTGLEVYLPDDYQQYDAAKMELITQKRLAAK